MSRPTFTAAVAEAVLGTSAAGTLAAVRLADQLTRTADRLALAWLDAVDAAMDADELAGAGEQYAEADRYAIRHASALAEAGRLHATHHGTGRAAGIAQQLTERADQLARRRNEHRAEAVHALRRQLAATDETDAANEALTVAWHDRTAQHYSTAAHAARLAACAIYRHTTKEQ